MPLEKEVTSQKIAPLYQNDIIIRYGIFEVRINASTDLSHLTKILKADYPKDCVNL